MAISGTDTIAAIATPPGKGGVGVIRVSGTGVANIATRILGHLPKPRYATFRAFKNAEGLTIDEGLALYFPGPNSFTGEDVLELQGHGGPVVMSLLLARVLEVGARLARPGEFSERAFLNDKIDLAQAEAIADLIDSATQQAAKGAVRSLQGVFSEHIRNLDHGVVALRMYVEAAIDFPEEEIDFLSDDRVSDQLLELRISLESILSEAQQGRLLTEGVSIALAGRPNAGKSSLMNLLSGQETSIVTDVAGTTRDLVRENIHLDGVPVHLIDTAGIRKTDDVVETEGVKRALKEVEQADLVVLLVDAAGSESAQSVVEALVNELPAPPKKLLVVQNKTDLCELPPTPLSDYPTVNLSALTGQGFEDFSAALKQALDIQPPDEGSYVARARHVDALNRTLAHLVAGEEQLTQQLAGELLAEELRLAHEALCEITGEFSSDDLLGEIFSNFCIGK